MTSINCATIMTVALACAVGGCREGASGSRLGQLAESARVNSALGPPPATSPASLLKDSAAADSAALASLPDGVRPDFDVDSRLARARRGHADHGTCREISDSTAPDIRKRLRVQEEDSLLILFVRADRRSGILKRVELLRRSGEQPQRGWVWDADRNETESVEWSGGTQQSYVVPAGTPTPRALRALGRKLLVLECG
ncbi:MAG TPA: hypothetical protein VEB19_18705 [Gemmatimonadaceae bacterium]|nr:hypothetical protein [Gemmatimonadaceae bacterium]